MEIRFLIGSMVGVGLFMVGHLITAVWWAGRMTANAESMNKSIDRLATTLSRHDDIFYEKREARDQIARRDKEISDLWGAINSMRDHQ